MDDDGSRCSRNISTNRFMESHGTQNHNKDIGYDWYLRNGREYPLPNNSSLFWTESWSKKLFMELFPPVLLGALIRHWVNPGKGQLALSQSLSLTAEFSFKEINFLSFFFSHSEPHVAAEVATALQSHRSLRSTPTPPPPPPPPPAPLCLTWVRPQRSAVN